VNARLRPGQAARHVEELRGRSVLTDMQAARLRAIVKTLADDGRFLLRDALVAAEFPEDDARGQDAFQDFRKRVNQAAATAGVNLALELDVRKTRPDQRHGWFTGGDLVDDDIASFTEAAASRTGIEHPVDQSVAELGRSRRSRVYVSFLPPADRAAARNVRALLRQLREHLALDPDQTWEVTDTESAAGLGEDPEVVRDRLCALADVRVVLVTPAYLAGDQRERDRALGSPRRVVAFALSGLPDGRLDLGPLRIHDIQHRIEPWDELTRTHQRRRWVGALTDAVRRALPPAPAAMAENGEPDVHLTKMSAAVARSRRDSDSKRMVEARLAETSLQESNLDLARRTPGNGLPAVDRLVAWARGRETQRLCALLGDVGMGKTTTVKLFTQELLKQRASGTPGPLPILFDLRDVQISALAQDMTLGRILNSMLDANRPPRVEQDQLNADVVRERVSQGDAVVVFDGLDEVLVHLSPHNQQLFTRQLWRAVDEQSGSKMLLTCRTQYFRTIREETSYFLGEERQGLRGEHYLALLMLPFQEDQVREYLAANLGWNEPRVHDFLATLASVHNLPELAQRPLTLRMIADQVEFIETAKLHGRTLRSVDLYREFVDRWLARDGSKHTLRPEHKHLLMEQLAAGLWRSGKNSWGPTQVEDWLLDLLDRRPDLQRHYRERVPDLWKDDFRTATFLSRDGDTFAFGHRSLFEYFLASYLCRALTDDTATGQVLEAWAMPVPSPETLDFLGQSIAGLPDEQRSAALAALRSTATSYVPHTSELALAYALRAAQHGHPHQSLIGVQLPGARLRGWVIGTDADRGRPRLPMAGANLTRADLRRATFNRVDLTRADLSGADLTNAELHGSRLASARLAGARAAGTILRECEIDGVDLTDANAYRAQLLRCTPQPDQAPGWLVAPIPAHVRQPLAPPRLRSLTGHTGSVRSVAYSPDDTHILTGSADGSARVWDAITGELHLHLTGHTDIVQSVAYSPDGTHILTGSNDRSARVWDATTGQPHLTLTGHTDWIQAVAYSPDGTHILTGSNDRSARVWDATTGQPHLDLTGHTDIVQSVAYSPDGTHILTGSNDRSARVWDATTGQPHLHLTGHTSGVQAVAYSPDGTQILTGSDDRSARVWDATTGELRLHLTGHTGSVWAVAYSPDGTHILTGSEDGTARVWDATTGESAGFDLVLLPGGEVAVFDAVSRTLVGASDGAWRWLGWTVIQDGCLTRLPAETYGNLPPLPHHAHPPSDATA
jgi:Pentapeptide repeats (8 copies)/WD domain, G-beta repeat/NACHT domain